MAPARRNRRPGPESFAVLEAGGRTGERVSQNRPRGSSSCDDRCETGPSQERRVNPTEKSVAGCGAKSIAHRLEHRAEGSKVDRHNGRTCASFDSASVEAHRFAI